MKVSIYTAVRDCVRNDYPFEEMIRHHLPLADEIIVNDGFSRDGTYERVCRIDPKVKVFRTRWERPNGENWWIHFKDAARRQCSGDWCIHLDCDEFIPEWEFDEIRQHLSTTSDVMVPVRFTNFYGNYRVFHPNPAKVRWVSRKMIIHRNRTDIEFWGDGSSVKLRGMPFKWETSARQFGVHHFGAVRHPGRLREAWWIAGRFRSGRSIFVKPPRFVFDLFPYDWRDSDYFEDLQIYEGPYVRAVTENPNRFTRDNMLLVRLLSQRKETAVAAG